MQIQNTKRFIAPILMALIAACPPSISKAKTIDVFPTDEDGTGTTIQAKINTAQPGDRVVFHPGNYQLRFDVHYWLKSGILGNNIIYDLDSAVISGSGVEHSGIFGIRDGGYLEIEGNATTTLRKVNVPISLERVPFQEIDIRNITFDPYDASIGYQNRRHGAPLGKPAFTVRGCTANSGNKLIQFSEGMITDDNSPSPGVENCTVSGLGGWGVDLPSYRIVTKGVSSQDYTKVVLGQDDINANVWVSCNGLVDPGLHEYLGSPKHNRYLDVESPFIGTPEDDNSNVTVGDFLPGTFIPIMFGGVHLDNGTAAGSYELVATLDSVRYFCDVWLAQGDPNDPNNPANDPLYDLRVDFNKDGITNGADFAPVAEKYKKGEEPISKAPVLEGQHLEGFQESANRMFYGDKAAERRVAQNAPTIMLVVYEKSRKPDYRNLSPDMIGKLTGNGYSGKDAAEPGNGDGKPVAKDHSRNNRFQQSNKPSARERLKVAQADMRRGFAGYKSLNGPPFGIATYFSYPS